jgi:mannose-binding lectin 1
VQDYYAAHTEAAAAEHHEPVSSHDSTEWHQDDRGWYWTSEKESPKDAPASSFKTDETRFEDLHSRITTINHQLDILFHDLSTFKTETEKRHVEMKSQIQGYAEHNKHLLETIHSLMDRVLRDVEGKDYKESLTNLHQAVAEGNQAVLMSIPHAVNTSKFSTLLLLVKTGLPRIPLTAPSAPDIKEHSSRWGFFIFLILATQALLLGSYVIYKRRKNRQPKKYL